MGSKGRHVKYFMPIMMAGHDVSKPYIEPFVGGGNAICECSAPIRLGSDVAQWAIALLEALSQGWTPPDILSEREYYDIKEDPHGYEPALVGFAGYCCSYAGKLWGGYARGNDAKGSPRNFAAEQKRNLLRQAAGLKGVQFDCLAYRDATYPPGSTVYMDPPYAATTGYKSGAFNHREFWDFCMALAETSRVFVSEYDAPPEWSVVWEKSVTNSLTANTGEKRGVEKLFYYKKEPDSAS